LVIPAIILTTNPDTKGEAAAGRPPTYTHLFIYYIQLYSPNIMVAHK